MGERGRGEERHDVEQALLMAVTNTFHQLFLTILCIYMYIPHDGLFLGVK